MRKLALTLVPLLLPLPLVLGCNDYPSPTAPLTAAIPTPLPASVSDLAATRTHTEFSGHADANIYLSCIDEVTHWVGDYHVTVDITTTPSGYTVTRIQGTSDPATFFVERANGVRYYMLGQGSTQRHEFVGPVEILTIAEPKVFRSAAGDVLVTNYVLQIVFDGSGNPIVAKAAGACP